MKVKTLAALTNLCNLLKYHTKHQEGSQYSLPASKYLFEVNAESYLEPSRTSKMELFCENN